MRSSRQMRILYTFSPVPFSDEIRIFLVLDKIRKKFSITAISPGQNPRNTKYYSIYLYLVSSAYMLPLSSTCLLQPLTDPSPHEHVCGDGRLRVRTVHEIYTVYGHRPR